MAPRALVWTYLASMLAAGTATLMLVVALMLRYLPHDYLEMAGLRCADEAACGTTLPIWVDASFSFLLGGALLGVLSFAVYAVSGQITATRRHGECLDLAVEYVVRPLPDRLRGRVLVVDDPQPRSYTCGFLAPVIVISSGLFDALDEAELEAVLAHEEGHLTARDNLLGLIGRTVSMSLALVPGLRFACSRMERAQELAADEYARRQTGDGILVASSLHKFVRSLSRPAGAPPAAGYAFAEDAHVGERIRGLLVEPAWRASRRISVTFLLALTLMFAVFSASALAFSDVSLSQSAGDPACHLTVGDGEQAHEVCTAEH